MHGDFLQLFDFKARERRVDHLLHGHALCKHGGDRLQRCDIRFQLFNVLRQRAGQHLNEQTACKQHAVRVRVYKHAECAHRGDLLAHGVIIRDVLGDLAADELHLAHIRLSRTVAADDTKAAVCTDCGADVQLAVRLQGHVYVRIVHTAAHIAVAVGDCRDGADGTAAVYAQRERSMLLLLHSAHDGRRGKQSSKRSGSRGAEAVQPLRGIYRIA